MPVPLDRVSDATARGRDRAAAGQGGVFEVLEDGTDIVLESLAPGVASVTLQQFTLDASAHGGKSVYLKISDISSGGWGHIAVDNIAYIPEPTSLMLLLTSVVILLPLVRRVG
ncbi:MAG: hypothetical protein IH962_05130 [Chloroflexi bacterium]|nr:hypothetical protein [Chloroflexota bacterium]